MATKIPLDRAQSTVDAAVLAGWRNPNDRSCGPVPTL
jgi:hypothetical protein